MVRNVKSRVETAKTWERVITWTEVVHLDVNLGCMEGSVINRAATVATGICVMKWTEIVNSDVTLVFMARNATLVVQFIYSKLPLVLSITVKLFDVTLVLVTICVIQVA